MTNIDLNKPISEYTFLAFDLETSGAYPVGSDIVEFGAVKWRGGQEVGRLQFLFKPREPMSDFNMSIHGITNEMVAESPLIGAHIKEIHEFFKDAVAIAHHAPFDMGFMAVEFERAHLPLPTEPVLCTSLLAQRWITGTENVRLQTLVKHFKLDGGAAHRAFDDAKSCLFVLFEIMKKMGPEYTLQKALESMGKPLHWQLYSVFGHPDRRFKNLCEAIYTRRNVEMVYQKGGGGRTEIRLVRPIGVVRNPDGDYLLAHCLKDQADKRFYISKISDVVVALS